MQGGCSSVLESPHLSRAWSPLDPDACSLGLLVDPTLSTKHREPGEGIRRGTQSWRKHWRLSPVRKGKRNYRVHPSLQELITQKDQLFPIFSEDRIRGNRRKWLRLRFRHLEEFPSSV